MRRRTDATMSKELARLLKRFEAEHALWAEGVARGEHGPYGIYSPGDTAMAIVTYLVRRPGLLPGRPAPRGSPRQEGDR